MYSIVLAANASSCVDSPALASVIAASTTDGRSCARALGEDGAVLGEQLVAVEADLRALLDRGEHLAADVVQQRDAGVDQDLGAEVGIPAGDAAARR